MYVVEMSVFIIIHHYKVDVYNRVARPIVSNVLEVFIIMNHFYCQSISIVMIFHPKSQGKAQSKFWSQVDKRSNIRAINIFLHQMVKLDICANLSF